MSATASQAAACVPENPRDACWKIRLINFTEDQAGQAHAGKKFIVRIRGDEYRSYTLDSNGESVIFSAPPTLDKKDVYFDLKILPEYNLSLEKAIVEAYGAPDTGRPIKEPLELKQMIWGGTGADDPKSLIANTCAVRLSYVLNHGTDCEFTVPRILVTPRQEWPRAL